MINREKLEQKFEEEYNRLNPEQKKAVDQIEGPVMVIAGPGTGKTQILSARVGKILQSDAQVNPSNILCLTYTDSGAVNMRRRLHSFIGAAAYSVNIFTFHAFCNTIIQENLSIFETRELDPISDLERIELFRKLIDSFPPDHTLKRFRGEVYYEIQNLQSLFSTMKREGWTPEFCNENIDRYLESLPNRPELFYLNSRAGKYNKGDKKPAYQKAIDSVEKLRAAVNEFQRFQQMMREISRYDFDDMINWVIQSFEKNPDFLAEYQEKFQYILVDEYQDTSGSQNRLIQLLINFWDRPNVFVVGDDDQSIFRFQGANVENMAAFRTSYENSLLTIILTENYRSTQPILDVSKSLIDLNNLRLVSKIPGLTKKLAAAKHKNCVAQHPSIKEFHSQRHEMVAITKDVECLLSNKTDAHRIAIIYKENKYGEELTKYFKQRNIPFYSKRELNILEIPLAQKIILLFRYLAAEHHIPYSGDGYLFEILHFDWFSIPSIEIAKLSVQTAQAQYNDKSASLRKLICDKVTQPAPDLFHPVDENLSKASALLESFIADVSNETIQGLLEKIVRKGGILNFIMASDEKHWHLQVLTGLFDFVKEETRRNPALTLQDLVRIFDLMIKEKICMPLIRISGSDKGVNLLTAHGAKGLEFEHVFFVGCNATFWEKKKKSTIGYKFPDTFFSAKQSNEGVEVEEEELRRLFYVALTRAEQHLTISYSRYSASGKEMEPSRFIAEIQDHHVLPTENIEVAPELLAEFQALVFEEERRPEIDSIEKEFVERLLLKFTLSVTALSNYLKCPLEFYFNNLIRIPCGKNDSMEFGSAIHYALEQLFGKMKTHDKKQFPSVEVFVQDFEWWMKRHRESFTDEQFTRRMQYGQEVLKNYYEKYVTGWNKIVTVEQRISTVIEGVPVKGKLDKLEFDGKRVNVVDYKTGNIEYAKEKLCRPNEKMPDGGDYWRQATFYKLLISNFKKDWEVVSAEFDFIEPNRTKEYCREKVMISDIDVEIVKDQIVTVWNKIQAHDFYIGCGKKDCHWCNFVKTNNLAVAMHDLQDEELEAV